MQYKQAYIAIAGVHATLVGALTIPAVGAPRAAPVFMKQKGIDFLPEETIERAKRGNPIEKAKMAKDPTSAWTDVYEYAAAIRAGSLTWEEVEKADMNTRLKYCGMLHRDKRTPGRFMFRLRVPNGIVTADQMRFYAESVEPYGSDLGVIDITTRQNIQLRGITLEDAPALHEGMHARNQTAFQSALDNVRNMVGNPLAGIDDLEMVDTRPYCNALNDLISLDPVTETRGNPVWGNLPRKFNIAVSGGRDDFSHTHINDIGLQPTVHGTTGAMGFNVILGGYMSIKRVAHAVEMDMWVPATVQNVVDLSEAILRIFRDEGSRDDRQKARLMWLIEEKGLAAFRAQVEEEMTSYGRGSTLDTAQPKATVPYTRRKLLGVHSQPQQGLSRVGVHVPSGRLSVAEARQLADLADKYSAGELRLTVEQNALLPNVADASLPDLLKEPALNDGRMSVDPGNIAGYTVSCTGSQFCGLGLVETKNNAERIAQILQQTMVTPKPLRIHWTGCPNSCGQVRIRIDRQADALAPACRKCTIRARTPVLRWPATWTAEPSHPFRGSFPHTRPAPARTCRLYLLGASGCSHATWFPQTPGLRALTLSSSSSPLPVPPR